MSRFEFFKNSDRIIGYDISLEESLGRDIFSWLVTITIFCIIGAVLGSVLPLILSIVYLFTESRLNKVKINIGVIIMCFYFLIDYNQGWVCSIVFNSFKAFKLFDNIASLNLALLFLNIGQFVWILNKKDYDDEVEYDGKNYNFHFIIAFIICMVISSVIFKYKIIPKYTETIKIEKVN